LLTAAALALLLSGSSPPSVEDPEYPLGKLRFPSLTAPGPRLLLTDLRYRVSQEGRTAQSLEVRVRLGRFAFLGGEVSGERRGIFFDTQRIEMGLSEEEGSYQVEAGYRAPRLLVRARGERRPPELGEGWLLDGGLALRLSPDLEILFRWREDTEPDAPFAAGPSTRVVRESGAGFLYQRGTSLDLAVAAARSTVQTAGGFELTRDALGGAAAYFRSPLELTAELGYERTGGRLPRREGLSRVDAQGRLGSHWLWQGSAGGRWERGVKLFEQEISTGLTFFGRRYRFAREGEAAARALALARRANAYGYNERRAYDLPGRRALRERLALSPRRDELAPDIDGLYRAQVAERNVAQAGLEIVLDSDDLAGRNGQTYHLFLAVPWRPALPFTRREESVDFLRLDYFHREDRFPGPGLVAVRKELSLELSLNREMSLVFRLEDADRTPLELATLAGRPRRYELAYVYAFGR